MSHSYLDSTLFKFLAQPALKGPKASSMQSGGARPEIRQNYSGGRIVFNAIQLWT